MMTETTSYKKFLGVQNPFSKKVSAARGKSGGGFSFRSITKRRTGTFNTLIKSFWQMVK
jgi:hypothetical protein